MPEKQSPVDSAMPSPKPVLTFAREIQINTKKVPKYAETMYKGSPISRVRKNARSESGKRVAFLTFIWKLGMILMA
ncbi:hypothetical protein ACS5NO_03910 [Larkinella sp. GY13]|uniref:hypothetical protein n=1 Tax=Larkinella sp. GY13 TaxID=3453720 RepID=UPI003EEA5E6F